MTNNEIVEILAKDRVVEKIISQITDGGKKAKDPDTLGDLANDIYLSLLLDKNLEKIYAEGHQKFYIARICTNNIISSSSRYYCQYLKPRVLNVGWNDNYNKLEDGGKE